MFANHCFARQNLRAFDPQEVGRGESSMLRTAAKLKSFSMHAPRFRQMHPDENTCFHPMGFRYGVLAVRDSAVLPTLDFSIRRMAYSFTHEGLFHSLGATLSAIWDRCGKAAYLLVIQPRALCQLACLCELTRTSCG